MALRIKKLEAIRMRKTGASYSQIKEVLHVSKSTLSLWLSSMPLSEKRIRELRDFSELRIERYRETRRRTKEKRQKDVLGRVGKEIGTLSKRELFVAGLFLYWAEGGKTVDTSVCVSNADPAMLIFFIRWLELLGVSKSRLKVKIHLYKDMRVRTELLYWSKVLDIPLSQFRKPYIKNSSRSGLSYPQRFTHGTGNVIFGNRDVSEKVLLSLDYIRSMFAEEGSV